MSQRWGIWLAIEGDLRFLSHHDMMRAIERVAARARLPLRYSQGFNPRATVSFVSPRPVGVAARGDLLVLTLQEPMEAEELLARLREHCPAGMRPLRAEPLADKSAARPRELSYELPLSPAQAETVRRRLDELAGQDAWPIERQVSHKPGRPAAAQVIDLHPMVAELDVRESALHVKLRPRGDLWARPGEVLRLLGLDDQVDLAATVRLPMELNK